MKDIIKIAFYVLGILATLYGVNTAMAPKEKALVVVNMPVTKDVMQATKVSNHDDRIKDLTNRVKALEDVQASMVVHSPSFSDDSGRADPESKETPTVESIPRPDTSEIPKVQIDPDDEEIPWQYNETEAEKLAKVKGRKVLYCFHSDGCAPCKWAADNIYTDKKVWRIMHRQYVPLWVYVSYDGTNRSIANAHGVKSYPTDKVGGKSFNPVPENWRSSNGVETGIARYLKMLE